MVFRDWLKEPGINMEGEACDSPVSMNHLQKFAGSQISESIKLELGSLEKNWHLLASVLLYKKDNFEGLEGGLLEKEVLAFGLDQVGLKVTKPMAVTRAGEDNNMHASDDNLLPGLNDDTALDILAWSCRSDYPSLACVNKKFKTLVRSGYLYGLRRLLGIVEHWIYLACILMPWEAFDPARQRWMRLPRIPCDECFMYADKESLAVGTELLVFGRELSGLAIWKYSLLTHDWSSCNPMELPRCLFGSSSLGEIAIVSGGSDRNGCILKFAELYNSESGTWHRLPDMNMQRKMCSGFFMDGKFYVIGGMSSPTNCLGCGEEYNLELRTWRRIENMYPISSVGHPAMRSPPLVAVVNNQLYSADQATNEVKKYDKTNNIWSAVKRLPVRADSSNGWGLAFKACGDSLLVIGGHKGPQGEVIVLHSWNPEDQSIEGREWNVLAVKERAGSFVYNCAVMGC